MLEEEKKALKWPRKHIRKVGDRSPQEDMDSTRASNAMVSTAVTAAAAGTVMPLVIVIGSSIILLCAGAMFLSDLRERCRGGGTSPHVRLGYDDNDHDAPVARPRSNKAKSKCLCWMHHPDRGDFPTIPHILTPEEQADHVVDNDQQVVSPVSTITASIGLERRHSDHRLKGLSRVDSDQYLIRSTNIIELIDTDRVSGEYDLASWMKKCRFDDVGDSTVDEHTVGERNDSFLHGDEDIPADGFSNTHNIVQSPHSWWRRHYIDGTVHVMSDTDETDEAALKNSGLAPSDYSSDVSVATILRSVHTRKSVSFSTIDQDEIYLKSSNGSFPGDLTGGPGLNVISDTQDATTSSRQEEARDEEDGSLEPFPPRMTELPQLDCLCASSFQTCEPTKERKLVSPLEELLEGGFFSKELRSSESMAVDTSYDDYSTSESIEEDTEIDDSACEDYVRSTFMEQNAVDEQHVEISETPKATVDLDCRSFRWKGKTYRKRNATIDGEEFVYCHSLPPSKNISPLSKELGISDPAHPSVDGFDSRSDTSTRSDSLSLVSWMDGSALVEI
jgi:hypothetical protein